MIIESILLTLGVLALLVGTYSDIRIREVPDFVSYTLIVSAILLRLLNSVIGSEWNFFIYGLIGLAIGLAIGFLMYYLGQWGGGDSKLIMGLFCVFATTPIFFQGNLYFNFPFAFLGIFFFNILFAGAVYSLIYSIVLLILNFKKFTKEFSTQYKENRNKFILLYVICVIVLISSFLFKNILQLSLIGLAMLIVLFGFLFLYVKSVEKSCFTKTYPVEKLREGDWIVNDIKVRNKKIYSTKDLGISKEQITILKKHNIKSVLVKEGVPFVPAFLLAFILTFFVGNWLFMLLV